MSKSVAVILTACITLILTSILWMGIGLLIYKTWMSEDAWAGGEPFGVELDAPVTAAVGEVFTMEVTATNPGDKTVTLGSVDIYDTFLEGFEVLRVTPTPERDDGIFDFHSYFFEGMPIEPGGSATVSFKLKAVKPGRWQGDVDCCTPMESFSTAVALIEVTGPAAQ